MTTTLQPPSRPAEPNAAVKGFLKQTHKLLIGGQWIDSSGGETFEVLNPADGSTLTRVAKGNAQDVDRAVKAARKAFDGGPWRTMPARARGRLLYKLADLIEQNAARAVSAEQLV